MDCTEATTPFNLRMLRSHLIAALRDWKDVFDRFPILDSPACHAIRAYFRLERFTPRYKDTGWKPKWELEDLRERTAIGPVDVKALIDFSLD
jgi:hypothetical protein